MDIKQYAYQQRRYLIVIAIVAFFFLVGLVKSCFAAQEVVCAYSNLYSHGGEYEMTMPDSYVVEGSVIKPSPNKSTKVNTAWYNVKYDLYEYKETIKKWHVVSTTFAFFAWQECTPSDPPEDEPDPCEGKAGEDVSSQHKASGRYLEYACLGGCEVKGLNSVTGRGEDGYYTHFFSSQYTGQECEVGTPNSADPTPQPDETPEDPEKPFGDWCDEQQSSCNQTCIYGASVNSCNEQTGESNCQCRQLDETTPEGTSEPNNDPSDQTPEDPTDSGNDNAVANAINNNLKKQISQGNQVSQQLSTLNQNQYATAQNTGKLLKAINSGALGSGISDGVAEGVAKGIENGIGDLEGKIDGVGDKLEEIKNELSEPQYTQEPLPEAITADENYSFSDRTSEFLGQMKTTSLFSVVGGLENLSGSGSPVYHLEGGETYGTHTFDMSDYDSALNKFKYFIHFLGLISAAGILILKR